MKLFIKRDTSSENSRYIVYDECYGEVYRISGKHNTSIERMYIQRDDKCIAKIRDTRLPLIRTCYVTLPQHSFHLVVTSTKDKVAITYHGVSLHLRGSIFDKSYDILDVDNSVVACVCRRYSAMKDAIEININKDKYELLCIASVVCMDSVCTNDAVALQTT